MRSYPCVVCNKRTKPKERRTLGGDKNKGFRKYLYRTFLVKAKPDDISCNRCRCSFYKKETDLCRTIQNAISEDETDPTYMPPQKKRKVSIKSPKTVTLNLSSVSGKSHAACCICKTRKSKLVTVPAIVRHNTLIDRNVIIPAGSRCCELHIADCSFTEEAFELMSLNLIKDTQFNRTELLEIIENTRQIALKTNKEE